MNLKALIRNPITRATFGMMLVAAGLQYLTNLAEEKANEISALDAAIAERVAAAAQLVAAAAPAPGAPTDPTDRAVAEHLARPAADE